VSTGLAAVRAGYGAVQLLWPDRSAEQLLAAGAGTDALHALSMAVLAVADRRWRRPAVVSGLTAAAFAACGALAARRAAQAIY
jgi:hypothetical protein